MADEALITGYYDILSQPMHLWDVGVAEEPFLWAGYQDDVPFFLPEYWAELEPMPNFQGEELLFNPGMLLVHDTPSDLNISKDVKDALAVVGLLASAVLVPEMLIPLTIAGSFALSANIMRKYSEPDSLPAQIADFLLKVNKVIFFCTSAVAVGHGLGEILGSNPAVSIIASGIASALNSAYNIIEENVEYSLIPPPTDKFPTTGIDKHSCVSYEDGSLVVGQLIPKIVNKMAGRTTKQTVKEALNTITEGIVPDNPLLGLPISFIANFSSNIVETLLNSGTRDLEHHLERDLIGAATKTLTKDAVERLSLMVMGTTNDYASTTISIFLSVLSRTFFDGYWDEFIPEYLPSAHEHSTDADSEMEDFENES